MPFGEGQGDNYQQIRSPFNLRGIDIMHPVDQLETGKYPYLRNVRAYVDGEIVTRPGITNIKDLSGTLIGGEKINSIYHFVDSDSTDYCYIVGTTGGRVYRVSSGGVVTLIKNGLSGNRLSYMALRPDRSPEAYLYAADEESFFKIRFDGTVSNAGIETIPEPPSAMQEAPDVLLVDDFLSANPESDNDQGNYWNKSVYASTLTQAYRTNTTINKILFDSGGAGGTGYCSIVPTTFDSSIGFHQRLQIGSGGSAEFVVVEQITNDIHPTTIESVVYESGVVGRFTAVLTENSTSLVPNCLLDIDSEVVRVEEVIQGPDNKFAFKGTSTGTIMPGDAVVGFKSFRCKCVNNHLPAEPIVCKSFQSILTGGPATGFWGNIRHNTDRDWSTVNGKPVEDNDEVTIGIYLSDPSLIKEFRIWAIVEPTVTTTYAATDADKNYYSLSFRPDDLTQFITFESDNTQLSTTFGRIQRQQYDNFNQAAVDKRRDTAYKDSLITAAGGRTGFFGRLLYKSIYPETAGKVGSSDTSQANSGKGQWYQLRFPIGLLKSQRVGTDASKTLKNIKSIMVNFFATDTVTVGLSS